MTKFFVALFFLILLVWWWFFFFVCLLVVCFVSHNLLVKLMDSRTVSFNLLLIFLMSKMELSHLFPRFLMRVK